MTGEIEMKSLFEQNGGTFSAVSDYIIPNLTLPDEPENQMEWVGRVNNIRACVDEIIQNELIYE